MLDKIFNKKKKEQDIFTVPERKSGPDMKSIPKLGPKALQQIVVEEEKYISVLVSKIEQIKGEYQKAFDKSQQLKQKNEVINGQVLKMSNEHQQLTIKFDNLQNSLQLMISASQQHLSSQLNFIKSCSSSLNSNQPMPKSIQQVFSLYQDRFQLCSKISQQNKFLKQKITDIELKFDEIRERYEEAQKEKGFNSLIPELMLSLQELKKERKDLGQVQKNKQPQENLQKQNETLLKHNEALIKQKQTLIKQKQNTMMQDHETMTDQTMIINQPKAYQHSNNNTIALAQCLACKKLIDQIAQLKQIKSTLIQQISEWSSKAQTLTMTLQQSSDQIKTLKGLKQQKQRTIKTLSQDLDKLTQENKKYVQDIEEMRDIVKGLEQSLDQVKDENSRLKAEVDKGIIKLTMKDNENAALNLRLSTIMAKNQEESSQQASQTQSPQKNPMKAYQQQIQTLNQQHKLTLNQLNNLKQQNSSQSSQLIRLSQSLQKSQLQLSKTRESLFHTQQMANSIQEKYKKLMIENEQSLMDKVKSLETQRGQNEKELIYLRNFKLTSDQEAKKVQGVKKVLQEQVKQLQTYKNDVETRILPSLRNEFQSTKKQLQRISEQKQMIQQNSLDNINQLNNNYQLLLTQKQSWNKQKPQLQVKLNQALKQSSTKRQQIQTFTQMIQNLNREMTDKMLQIQKISDDHKSKSRQCQQLYEQLRSKQRKYQSQLNQQRIRLQTMKRTITVQQSKLQQNQKSSNKFYEQSMHKDKKITYMEVKLKEYKHLIQSLKKQKEQVEKTYIEKIKTYEESIVEVISQDEDTDRKKKMQEENKLTFMGQAHQSGQPFSADKDADYFRNQLLSYEQSNLVLKQQNLSLRQQIKQLDQQLHDRKKQVQNLQQKRQQTLKQIQKLNLRSINGSLQQPTSHFLQKQKQFLKQREQFEAYKQKTQQRMKKIALKAYKGFDILLKRHHSLYKEFMAVFVKEIADRQEVKNIQSEINMLVNKSTDMKDVFQDYI